MKSLKLNVLANQALADKEMNHILGGGTPGECCCGCGGPSSTQDNGSANIAKGLHSKDCNPLPEVVIPG